MTSINELREGALLPAPWAHLLRFFSLCFPALTASAEHQESENEGRRDDRDCRFARSLSSSGILVRIWGEATNKAALITRTNEKQTGARIFPENARRREGTLYSKTTPLPRSSECISVAAVNHVQVGGFLRLSIFTCLPCERLTKQGILAPVHPKPANIFWRQSGSFEARRWQICIEPLTTRWPAVAIRN